MAFEIPQSFLFHFSNGRTVQFDNVRERMFDDEKANLIHIITFDRKIYRINRNALDYFQELGNTDKVQLGDWCLECRGSGNVFSAINSNVGTTQNCPNCNGTGKVDTTRLNFENNQ